MSLQGIWELDTLPSIAMTEYFILKKMLSAWHEVLHYCHKDICNVCFVLEPVMEGFVCTEICRLVEGVKQLS